MKWTRHQFARAGPGQQVDNRAVAGRVTDFLLSVRRLEIVDVQHLPRARRSGKTREQGVSSVNVMFRRRATEQC